jgi:protein phosphatase
VSWPTQGYISFAKLLVKGELNEPDFLAYLKQAAIILAPLHNENRDLMLSPESILVDPLAKSIKFAPYPVDRSLAFPYFEGLSAPEISRHEFTPKSDIFLLGALAFFFYLGRFPSGNGNLQRILKNLYVAHPRGIDYLVKRAMWPSYSGRLSDASEFASVLNEILERESNNTTASVSTIDVGADYNVGVHKGHNRGYQSQDNEDCLFWDYDPSQSLYFMAIADGVTRSDVGTGREAADILMHQLHSLWQAYIGKPQEISKISIDIKKALDNTNQDIVSRVATYLEERPTTLASFHPMSTAACVAVIANGQAIVANVGNVRAYLIFGNCVAQLTQDDTPIAQAILDHKLPLAQAIALSSSELTQVVGQARMDSKYLEPVPLDIHLSYHDLRPGEALVLLSDGAFDYDNAEECFENELLNIVKTSEGAQQAAYKITAFANERGGYDNISCIVAKAEE